MVTQQDIEKLAELSRIEVSNEEKEELVSDITSILEYISHIQEVVSPEMESVVGAHHNIMRDDAEPHARAHFTQIILKEASDTSKGYIKVKKILS